MDFASVGPRDSPRCPGPCYVHVSQYTLKEGSRNVTYLGLVLIGVDIGVTKTNVVLDDDGEDASVDVGVGSTIVVGAT